MLRRSCPRRLIVTLVRHSESTNNVLNAEMAGDKANFNFQRQADPSLTQRGVMQAERVAQRLALENCRDASLIITSYFHRALRTAAVIEEAIKDVVHDSPARVLVDKDFHEVGGHYIVRPKAGYTGPADETQQEFIGTPGRTRWNVIEEFPTFQFCPGQTCEAGWYTKPKKETLAEAKQRAMRLWSKIAEHGRNLPAHDDCSEEGPSIIVVTHGYLYSVMMNEAKRHGMFTGETPDTFARLTNTAITRLRIKERGRTETSLWTSGITNKAPATSLVHSGAASADGIFAAATRELYPNLLSQAAKMPEVANSESHARGHGSDGIELEVLLDNCDRHVRDLGSLVSSAQPLY